MKKVLLVFPGLRVRTDEGSKHRLNCHINEYRRHGYDVTVLAICKDALYGCDSKYLNSNAHWIIRPYILPFAKHIILTKILEVYIKLVQSYYTWKKKYDVVQMEINNYRSILCRNSSLYITDIHGDSANEVREMQQGKEWFVDYNMKMQGKIADKSDICIVVSENLKRQIEYNTGKQIKDYVIISCGVDVERFEKAQKASLCSDNLEGRIVLGYCGGFQKWQNFNDMIDLVVRLRKLDERFYLLVFSNSDIETYRDKLNELGEENYFIKGLLPQEVPSHIKLMDAGLLLRSDLVLNRVSSPTKICEYLAAGVPLVCTQYSGDYLRSINHLQNGFVGNDSVFSDTEIKDLAKWLNYVKQNRKEIAKDCVLSVRDRTFKAEFNSLAEKIQIKSRNQK